MAIYNFIHQPHDKFFKLSMTDIRVAKDLFENHLPPTLLAQTDLSTLKLQNSSFTDDDYNATEADIVYTAKVSEELAYFYILCEHQSEIDPFMALRLLIYITRIWKVHIRQNPKGDLPLVYPLVVYSGDKPWGAAQDIYELFGKQEVLAREILLKPYQLVDVQRKSDDDLQQQFWSGWVAFAMKYRKVKNFGKKLEDFCHWLRELEGFDNFDLGNFVIQYLLDGGNIQKEYFVDSSHNLGPKLKGVAMTLAEQFEADGFKKGLAEGKSLAEQFKEDGFKKGLAKGKSLAEQFKEDGFKKGLAEGKSLAEQFKEDGFKKGQDQGLKQGLEKGYRQSLEAVVIRLHSKGKKLSTIADITGLSLDEIKTIVKPSVH